MLDRVDRALGIFSWVAAGFVVLMLLIGPVVIAEDKPQQAAGAQPYAAPSGKAVFSDRCGSCHTLKAAGTNGQVGPDLDGVSLRAAQIATIVREGRGGMPAFGGDLSDAEISAVAAFVAGAR